MRFFDRLWLINLILWGNYVRLRDAALQALGERLPGRTLVGYCSEVCPKGVDPARAVNQNKIESTKDYFLRFLKP